MNQSLTVIAALNAAHGLGDALQVVAGPGGMPVVEVNSAQASARIALHGAQVLSFKPHSEASDLLFLSDRAVYLPGKAIRGGVPICWPWFGPDPLGLGHPNHGFARTSAWQLANTARLVNGDVQAKLVLRDTPETRDLWPHAFELTLHVSVGQQLRLELSTHNTGDTAFSITQALHSYFAVADLAQVQVLGLDGARYLDNATGAHGATREQVGAVKFDGEVDRVYQAVPPELTLSDQGRQIHLLSEGSCTAVVWNPGSTVAARLPDLAPGDQARFVCVETANAGDEVVRVAPGHQHVLAVELSAASPFSSTTE